MTPEKKEAAIKWLIEEVRSLRMAPKLNGCGTENWQDQLEIMETCLEAVRDHFPDTRKMVPLTIEQLREMDGPVWCSCKPLEGGNGYWCLCKKGNIITPGGSIYNVKEIPNWVFYAYPPARIDRESWTAKWKSKESPWNGYTMVCSKCGETIKSLSGQMPFCPACGRAMTPKAWDELEKRLRGVRV